MTRKKSNDSHDLLQSLAIPTRRELRNRPLSGERISLAPVEPADGPELWHAVESSREHLARWLPWVPFNDSEETSQHYAEACASDWDNGRALRFAIRLHRGQQLLGVVGLDNCVHMHRNCDLGYWLIRRATGQGLMTEAARLCLGFAFRVVGMQRVRCAAATHNDESLKVIERLRFQREGVARHAELLSGRWVDHMVFSLLAAEFDVTLG